MVSKIVKNKPNEFMSFKHLGIVKNGVEVPEGKETKQWAGAFENHSLRETGGKTALLIEMYGADIPKEFQDYFMQTWPKAISKLKELAEKE